MTIFSDFVSTGVENDVKGLLTGGGGWDLLYTKITFTFYITNIDNHCNDAVLIWCVQWG